MKIKALFVIIFLFFVVACSLFEKPVFYTLNDKDSKHFLQEYVLQRLKIVNTGLRERDSLPQWEQNTINQHFPVNYDNFYPDAQGVINLNIRDRPESVLLFSDRDCGTANPGYIALEYEEKSRINEQTIDGLLIGYFLNEKEEIYRFWTFFWPAIETQRIGDYDETKDSYIMVKDYEKEDFIIQYTYNDEIFVPDSIIDYDGHLAVEPQTIWKQDREYYKKLYPSRKDFIRDYEKIKSLLDKSLTPFYTTKDTGVYNF